MPVTGHMQPFVAIFHLGSFVCKTAYRAGNVTSIRSALHWPVRSFVDGSRTRVELALD
jgi:hypothetical protein